MAFIHEDPVVLSTEEETEIIRIWILHKVDEKEVGDFYPTFSECRPRMGALHITCTDLATKDWLCGLVEREELF